MIVHIIDIPMTLPVYRISQEKCSQKLPKVVVHLAVSPGFSYVKQCETNVKQSLAQHELG